MLYSELPDMSDHNQEFIQQQQQHPPLPPYNHSQSHPPSFANNTSPGAVHHGARGGGREDGLRAGGIAGNRNGNNNSSSDVAMATVPSRLSRDQETPSPDRAIDGACPKGVQQSEAPPQLQQYRYDRPLMPRTFPSPSTTNPSQTPSPRLHFTTNSASSRPPFDASSRPPFPPSHPAFHQNRLPSPLHLPMPTKDGARYHPYPRPQAIGRAQDRQGIWR